MLLQAMQPETASPSHHEILPVAGTNVMPSVNQTGKDLVRIQLADPLSCSSVHTVIMMCQSVLLSLRAELHISMILSSNIFLFADCSYCGCSFKEGDVGAIFLSRIKLLLIPLQTTLNRFLSVSVIERR